MEGLGAKLSYFRKSKGLSIKKLAENLCDDSTIYRMEKGKQLPRLEILNDICNKLEIPFQALFPFNEEVVELKKRCRELTYTEDYLTLELTLEECSKVLVKLNSTYSKMEFKKFIQWHRAILFHKKDNEINVALNTLNSLVKLENCASELDISILNSIGLIHLSNKNVPAALKIYEVIYPKIKEQKVREDFTIPPRIGYNYADSMYKSKNYNQALEIIKEVLYYVKDHQLLYSLGEIYHMIGVLSKKVGHLTEAEEAFKNAILVFSLAKDKVNLARTESDLSNLKNDTFHKELLRR